MNGIYWGLTALCIMGHQDALDRDQMITFVMSCWDDEAGLFRPWADLAAAHLPQAHSAPTRITMHTSYPR